ncbi:hypothetical protein R6Q59_007626 [Mikania micrantha]
MMKKQRRESKGKQKSKEKGVVIDTSEPLVNPPFEGDYGSDWFEGSDEEGEDASGAPGTTVESQKQISEEIQKTMEVGECLGLDIRHYELQLKDLIEAEHRGKDIAAKENNAEPQEELGLK